MLWKHLALVAGAGLALTASASMSQAMEQNPRARSVEGMQLRRVAVQDSGFLVYDYKTDAGVSRVSVDTTGLVSDLERARKRAPHKKAAVKSVSAPAATPPRTQPDLAKAEIATVDMAAPVASEAPVSHEAKKVRVIPLYNVPNVD